VAGVRIAGGEYGKLIPSLVAYALVYLERRVERVSTGHAESVRYELPVRMLIGKVRNEPKAWLNRLLTRRHRAPLLPAFESEQFAAAA